VLKGKAMLSSDKSSRRGLRRRGWEGERKEEEEEEEEETLRTTGAD